VKAKSGHALTLCHAQRLSCHFFQPGFPNTPQMYINYVQKNAALLQQLFLQASKAIGLAKNAVLKSFFDTSTTLASFPSSCKKI